MFDDDVGYHDDGFDDDDWGASQEEEARQRKRLQRKGEGRRVSFARSADPSKSTSLPCLLSLARDVTCILRGMRDRTSVVTTTTTTEEVSSPSGAVVSKKVRREAAAAAARQRRDGVNTTTSLVAKSKASEKGTASGRAGRGRRKQTIMFQPLWAYLKKERGWHYKKGSGLVNWYASSPLASH